MSALGAPTGKKPAFLPFKRTAKRRAAPATSFGPSEDDDESLSMFNQRKVTYFDDQKKLAAEKAARQKAREEQAAKEKGKSKANNSRQVDEEDSPGSLEPKTSSPIRRRDSDTHSSKRKRIVISSGDETDSGVEIFSRPNKIKPAKPTTRHSTTPDRRRASLRSKSTPQSSKPSKTTPTKPTDPRNVISLEDSDDEFVPSSESGKGKGKMLAHAGDRVTGTAQYLVDDASSEDEIFAYGEDDLESKYIREAQERMEERRRNRLALETKGGESSDGDAAAEILIVSRLKGIQNLKIKIQISKKMQLVREAWAAKSKQRLEGEDTTIRPATIDSMFFTWKGNKIYDFTTLSGLGIKPVDQYGGLYPSSQGPQDGYVGWDKVHIEAWTQELYDQHLAHLERESRRRLGDLDDDEFDAEPEPAPPPKIRIVLRSKELGDQPLKVPLDCTIKLMIKAFRKQRKEQLKPDQPITLHFDGQVLDEASTAQDYEIEDEDVIEVHL